MWPQQRDTVSNTTCLSIFLLQPELEQVERISPYVLIGQLPSNGVFRLNGTYAFGFGKYYHMVLSKWPHLPSHQQCGGTAKLSHQPWVCISVHFLVGKWHIILFRVNSLRKGFLLLVH